MCFVYDMLGLEGVRGLVSYDEAMAAGTSLLLSVAAAEAATAATGDDEGTTSEGSGKLCAFFADA